MKLIIDIDADVYDDIEHNKGEYINTLNWAVRNGIPYEERPQGEWIPVSKCWPAFSGLYLVSIDDLVTVANFTGAYFINKRGLMLNVSAWQLLPKPYKESGAK